MGRCHVADLVAQSLQLGLQLRQQPGVGGVVVQAEQLERVGREVEELPLLGSRFVDGARLVQRVPVVVDELVPVGAHASVRPDAV